MVSLLALSAVYRVFEPQSGQTKDYKIGNCASTLSTQLRIRIMCSSGATWLPADCCISEKIELQKINWIPHIWKTVKATTNLLIHF
jgi:hypothetical protein